MGTKNIKGMLPKGKYNKITDVQGVRVGHFTLEKGDQKTGITAILPHGNNVFKEKVVANAEVINGFGKSVGILQIQELGNIETPILLTNTLSVGEVTQGLVDYMLEQNPEIGDTTGTVNPVVCECNDGVINAIRTRGLQPAHGLAAIQEALKNQKDFEEGSVGAGRGMIAYGLKGGIGSASRRIFFGEEEYTIGVLVLANFGQKEWLMVEGRPVGQQWKYVEEQRAREDETSRVLEESLEKGSVIVVMATDIPMTARQLGRLARRGAAGLARTGSYIGHGSGDVVLAFSTANPVVHEDGAYFSTITKVNEDKLDRIFKGAVEATEESVISAMIHSKPDIARSGRLVNSLEELLEELKDAKK